MRIGMKRPNSRCFHLSMKASDCVRRRLEFTLLTSYPENKEFNSASNL